MKKIIMMAILAAAVFQSCMKQNLKVSDEVLVSVLNQCTATISFYDTNSDQYSKNIFDCEYISVLRMKITPGTYRVKAETNQGKSVTKTFTKSVYAQTLDIEF